MSHLTLHLLDGQQHLCLDKVHQLVASDASGQFGLLPGHEYLVTALVPGLLHYQDQHGLRHFLATAGGLLSCQANQVHIISTRLLQGDSEQALLDQLQQLQHQEHLIRQTEHQSRDTLERHLLRRLREWSEKRV